MNLNQITVPVKDVASSILFYESIGLRLIVKALPHYARFVCSNGTTFSVHHVIETPQGEGIWVYFEVDNLDDTVQALEAKGVVFESSPKDQPWLWREASLKDPDGNHLILYYAGKNRLDPPWHLP